MKPKEEEKFLFERIQENSIRISERSFHSVVDRGTRDESVETRHGRTGNVKAIARRIFLRGR